MKKTYKKRLREYTPSDLELSLAQHYTGFVHMLNIQAELVQVMRDDKIWLVNFIIKKYPDKLDLEALMLVAVETGHKDYLDMLTDCMGTKRVKAFLNNPAFADYIKQHPKSLKRLQKWVTEDQAPALDRQRMRVSIRNCHDLSKLRKVPKGEQDCGLIEAARHDCFDEVIKLALRSQGDTLSISDFLFMGKSGERVIEILATRKHLKDAFTPSLWRGRADEMIKLWHRVPEEYQKGFDITGVLNSLRRSEMRHQIKVRR